MLRGGIPNGLQYGGFPKLGVTSLGVPIIRTIVFWGLYWGPLILGNYHMECVSPRGGEVRKGTSKKQSHEEEHSQSVLVRPC